MVGLKRPANSTPLTRFKVSKPDDLPPSGPPPVPSELPPIGPPPLSATQSFESGKCSTSSQTSIWYDEPTKFRKIISDCGVKLSNSINQPSELDRDPVNVIRDLTAVIEKADDTDSFLESFSDGFQRYIRVPTRLHAALLPTHWQMQNDYGEENGCAADSIARLLLKTEPCQKSIAQILLVKLNDVVAKNFMSQITISGDFPQLIVNQFRYLDSVTDKEFIAGRFLSIIARCDDSLKVSLLGCLPEIVGDNQAEMITTKLCDLMDSSTTVLAAILNAISNFTLSSETLLHLRTRVLDSFAEYELEDKVIALKFLLQTAPFAGDIEQLFFELRNIDFAAYLDAAAKEGALNKLTKRDACQLKDEKTSAVLMANILETSLKYDKVMSHHAIRAETAACSRGEKDKFVSMLITLILFGTKHRKKILTMIHQKLRNGCWTSELLDECFRNPEAMLKYTLFLLEIADILLRTSERRLTSFGSLLYVRCFSSFSLTVRQEVISALLTHVSGGNNHEASWALDTLNNLATSKDADGLNEFAALLQSLLEFLPSLKLHHIRKVFALLGRMSTFCAEDSVASLDDMHIFVRKNINGMSIRQRAIGVLAAATLYRFISSTSEGKSQAQELYKLGDQETANCVELRVLFYDELAEAIYSETMPDVSAVTDVRNSVQKILEREFLWKPSDQNEWKRGIVDGQLFGDLSVDQSTALQLVGNMVKFDDGGCSSRGTSNGKPLLLASVLRLYIACCAPLEKNLDDIKYLLEIPLLICKKDDILLISSASPQDQRMCCQILFYAIDCLRELLNGFCRCDSATLKKPLIQRVQQLVSLQEEFERCVQEATTFSIDDVCIDYENNGSSMVAPVKPKKQPKKTKALAKLDVKDGKSQMKSQSEQRNSQTTQQTYDANENAGDRKENRKSDGAKTAKTGSRCSQYFRELDFSVFKLLAYTNISNFQNESDERVCAELQFLLTDLAKKLCHLSVSTLPMKRPGFATTSNVEFKRLNSLSVASIKEHLLQILPHVWKHLCKCMSYFSNLMEKNDGIADSLETGNRTSTTLANVAQLCLDCLVYSINCYAKDDSKFAQQLLIATVNNSSLTSQATLESAVSSAIDTLRGYTDSAPTIALGVSIIRALSVLVNLKGSESDREKVAETAQIYLKRDWNIEESEIRAIAINGLAQIIELALPTATSTGHLDKVEQYVEAIAAFAHTHDETDSEENTNELSGSMSKSNVHIWYRTVFNHLVNAAKDYPRLNVVGTEVWFKRWAQIVRCLRLLINIVHKIQVRTIIGTALQNGHQIVRLFTNHAIPVLEKTFFKIDPKNVREILSVIQNATRMLHTICMEMKMNRDGTLTRFVPPLKKALEEFVFRVKAMMAANDCVDALTIGLLKNKNLQGETVCSQSSTGETTQEETVTTDCLEDERISESVDDDTVVQESDPDGEEDCIDDDNDEEVTEDNSSSSAMETAYSETF